MLMLHVTKQLVN